MLSCILAQGRLDEIFSELFSFVDLVSCCLENNGFDFPIFPCLCYTMLSVSDHVIKVLELRLISLASICTIFIVDIMNNLQIIW